MRRKIPLNPLQPFIVHKPGTRKLKYEEYPTEFKDIIMFFLLWGVVGAGKTTIAMLAAGSIHSDSLF